MDALKLLATIALVSFYIYGLVQDLRRDSVDPWATEETTDKPVKASR